jgi:apolipoprotein N-acyltransferase
MSFLKKMRSGMPAVTSLLLVLFSALLLAAAFPGFEFPVLAWIALIPLLAAVDCERKSRTAPFLMGWLFGTVFFFLTCWWLTFAPIRYAGFPVVPTYLLLIVVSACAGVFAGFFGLVYGVLRNRIGRVAILAAPFVWEAFEFLRYWLTGNNWNALGYSQAFEPSLIQNASIGGVYLTGFTIFFLNAAFFFAFAVIRSGKGSGGRSRTGEFLMAGGLFAATLAAVVIPALVTGPTPGIHAADIVAIQPDVPMDGLDFERWRELRTTQEQMAEGELRRRPDKSVPVLVVLPESPMNYQYGSDAEFRDFIDKFAKRNSAAVLFNSAEVDPSRERGFFNSAVMVSANGEKVAQYDKIHLLPFGEFVPLPEFAQELIPPMVGRFSQGNEYDLLEVGGAKAGVMICFESHFPSLSGEYARRGAGFLIEMTNDGYLGNTPVLRQHLANAVFRAVETRLPLMRVTNVGITAKIDGRGRISDEQKPFVEAVRTWSVEPKEGGLTFYSVAGDWFAVLCCFITGLLLLISVRRRKT